MSDMAAIGQRRSVDMAGLTSFGGSELRVKRTRIIADPSIPNNVLTLPAATGTLALASEIVLTPGVVTLTGEQTLTNKTLVAPIMTSITNVLPVNVPDSGGTLATQGYVSVNAASVNTPQAIQNKSFVTSSNTQIASVAGAVMTTTNVHNLLFQDIITFPNIGSLTGITASTNYQIAPGPGASTFSLVGVAAFGGTVGTAYYYLKQRGLTNYAAVGGIFEIDDASNTTTKSLRFDVAGANFPVVIRSSLNSANPYILPGAGGTLVNTASAQTISGNLTLSGTTTTSGALLNTRAGQIAVANSTVYVNPASVAFSAANNYFWTTFQIPASSGNTTGTVATVRIIGPPAATAANKFALQVEAGAASYPAGTVAAPSVIFGNSAGSGIYSVGANVINVGISGVALITVNSTGLTLAGNLNANGNTFCRDASGNYMLTRALKGVSTPVAGVVTFQMTLLSGSTFGSDGAGVFIVTMALESGDFGLTRASWSAIIERSSFSGGKAEIVSTLTSVNVSLATVSTGGLVSVTVTAATTSNYAFTQMQICY